jgi:hypothetical protein
MRQGAVERALGKLVTDDAFRARFFAEPALASLTAGLALSPVELEVLAHLSPRVLAHCSRRLDDRIRRLPIAAAQRAAPRGGGPQTPTGFRPRRPQEGGPRKGRGPRGQGGTGHPWTLAPPRAAWPSQRIHRTPLSP